MSVVVAMLGIVRAGVIVWKLSVARSRIWLSSGKIGLWSVGSRSMLGRVMAGVVLDCGRGGVSWAAGGVGFAGLGGGGVVGLFVGSPGDRGPGGCSASGTALV